MPATCWAAAAAESLTKASAANPKNVQASPAPSPLDAGLNAVETALNALDAALLAGDAPAFEAHSGQLHHALLQFQQQLSATPPAEPAVLAPRLQALARRLAFQRESMARRAVPIEKQIKFMLPSLGGVTYSRNAGAYGAGDRQAGQFTSIRA